MTITDEILEVAQKAANVATSDCLRAALEAIAPLLIAQGMRELAMEYGLPDSTVSNVLMNRAQELDPE